MFWDLEKDVARWRRDWHYTHVTPPGDTDTFADTGVMSATVRLARTGPTPPILKDHFRFYSHMVVVAKKRSTRFV